MWLVNRLRWMTVPIAAYLVMTLGLPIANGAATRAGFARHAELVLGVCGAMVAIAAAGGLLVDLGLHLANRPRDPDVSPGGR